MERDMDWLEQEVERKYHPTADLFPLLDGQEYVELRDDIAKNGLLEAIWLHQDGSIIDGRNRHRACIETLTRPTFRTWTGDGSLVSFVVSLNLKRRHLTASQRGVIALDVLPMLEEEAKERQVEAVHRRHLDMEKIPELETGNARDQAADMFQVNAHYVQDAKRIQQDAPELLEDVRSGEMTIPQAVKKVRKRKRETERAEMAQAAQDIKPSDRWQVFHADMQTWTSPRQYDFIITDPPYPREYLPLYEVLAIRAVEWLEPGGLLVAMCGQSYFDEIMEMMSQHLAYYWTAAYLTPGQPTPLRQRQVNTTWKPLLMFTRKEDVYRGKIFGDVFTSSGSDKEHHDWGQSVSGMLAVIKQVCLPGQWILDPFCGAGATGVAALEHGCLFHGVELDESTANLSKKRLAEND